MLNVREAHEVPSDQQRHLGALMLRLLVDTTWVHRRVEKVAHSDPVTVRRTKSIDFTLPTDYESPLDCIDGRRLDYVPLAIMSKWRIANIDMRDESGAALPLIDRRQHTPIGAAMLIALGHLTRELPIPMSASDTRMPPSIEHACWEIAGQREERSLGVCEELALSARDEDAEVSAWRRELAADYVFMGLAWMMARGFLLLVPLYDAVGVRRIVKFGYDAYRYRQGHRSLRPSADQQEGDTTETSPFGSDSQVVNESGEQPDSEERRTSGSPVRCATPKTGRLLVRILWNAGRSSELTEPAATPVVVFQLENNHGISRSVKVVGTEVLVDSLPEGAYRVCQPESVAGYEKVEEKCKFVLIEPGRTTDVHFIYEEEPKRVVSLKPPIDVPADSWLPWLSEEVGLTSRRVMFGLWLDDSASTHFEFEAPNGFVVTRIKLSQAKSGGEVMDMSARSSQRADVYVYGAELPTRALVLANVRPRSETIVDLSWIMACVTAITLLAYAIWHGFTGHAPSGVVTVFLASPGALAAFAAQAPPEVTVSRMTAGLRYFTLLPGLVAFAAAVTTVAWPTALGGEILDAFFAGVAAALAGAWTYAHLWTLSPPERGEQGPARSAKTTARELPDAVSAEGIADAPDSVPREAESSTEIIGSYLDRIKEEIESKCEGDPLWAAYEVRVRMREESQAIPQDLRDEYLEQTYKRFIKPVVRPPSMFIDSGEVAPTFVGLYEIQRKALEAVVCSADRDDEDDATFSTSQA